MLDEGAQISPAVSTGPLERPTQTAGCAPDSLVGQIGQSVVHRSGPRKVADTPQLQALLEDLADLSATVSEGDGNSEEDRAVLCFHCVSCFGTKDCLPKGVQNFFLPATATLQLQVADRNATNRMVISYLIATHFLHRWPASRVAILLNLKRVYCHLQGVSVGPNGR